MMDTPDQDVRSRTGASSSIVSVIGHFSGTSAILPQLELLKALAVECGQTGEMDQLPYYLSAACSRAKEPHLLLLGSQGAALAAVLMCEYRIGILPTRLFFSLDFTGQRTVLAPASLRPTVAAAAAAHLLRRGALLAVVSVCDGGFEDAASGNFSLADGYAPALLKRTIFDLWELGDNYDDTLSALGKHTRRNFRNYLRQLDASYGAVYFPTAEISQVEFLEMNLNSTHPSRRSLARWRYRAAQTFAESRIAGLRSADGRWLSLIGLRSRNGLTDVDWQMNRPVPKGVSIVTGMRSYLLRNELERGTRFLRFDHGTSHSMNAGFRGQVISHFLLTHRFLSPHLLRTAIKLVLAPDNLLVNVVCSPELVWQGLRGRKSGEKSRSTRG